MVKQPRAREQAESATRRKVEVVLKAWRTAEKAEPETGGVSASSMSLR